MDQIPSALQIRAGSPFGYLAIGPILLAVSIILIVIVFRRIIERDIFDLSFGSAIVGLSFISLVVVANFRFSDKLDLNPSFTEADLIGHWSHGASSLLLKPDGSAEFAFDTRLQSRIGIENGKGYWMKSSDFLISFDNHRRSTQNTILRVILYDTEYRMIIEDFSDYDEWDGDLGFQKTVN